LPRYIHPTPDSLLQNLQERAFSLEITTNKQGPKNPAMNVQPLMVRYLAEVLF
jgi:hypothetical protein